MFSKTNKSSANSVRSKKEQAGGAFHYFGITEQTTQRSRGGAAEFVWFILFL